MGSGIVEDTKKHLEKAAKGNATLSSKDAKQLERSRESNAICQVPLTSQDRVQVGGA